MQRIKKFSKQITDGGERCPHLRKLADEGRSNFSECPFLSHGNGDSHPSMVKPLHVSAAMPSEIASAMAPSEVKATPELSKDPVKFLIKCAKKHPEAFIVDRGGGYKYAVLNDPSLFEDVLTFDEDFGNPVTPNMQVNHNIFQISKEQLARHEVNVTSNLRKFLLNNNEELANSIAHKLVVYMRKVLGESGTMDVRDFGVAIFWPMTEALFGERASLEDSSFLFEAFENIDNFFGKALKGRDVPQVKDGVSKAYALFSDMLQEAKGGGRDVGPVIKFYDEITKHEDPDLTAKFSTAAWWGGQGNTLPSTMWTFGMILSSPEAKRKVYEEIDGPFMNQPDQNGNFDFETLQYMTAALKETLRMKTFSIAWRQAQNDVVLTAKSGKKYLFPKGMLIGLHFALRHNDKNIFEEPEKFKPERFVGSGSGLSPTINGHKYAWAPFSAGRHKCSGYPLAMLEIPLVMALVFREYEMELLDPLPGLDYQQAFGVVGADNSPCRVKYTRRKA